MEIKMVDLHGQYLRIKPEIDSAIQSVMDSTAFIQGKEVQEFATALSKFAGGAYVVPCANGTDALQIAMMALGLKPGEEVILPVHTYVATAEVIALLGLTPVFVDVDADTFNIDVDKIERVMTKKTKAIVPVHLYGQCADMDQLMDIASKHNIRVIEDAAQSIGAKYKGRFSGTIGDVGTTSFFPSKNLGCFGDGGAIFTRSADLAEEMRVIANHGQKKKYHHERIGVNSRLDTIQAAILNVKLRYLHEYEKKRNKVANYYDEHLNGVTIPVRAKNSTHVFHQYTIKVQRRDALKEHLASRNIPTMIYYPVPLHRQKAYFQDTCFPVTEQLSGSVLSLPIHTEMTEEQLDYICRSVNELR
ncbi:MAG TPA: DegT/DnrJ/EryC1/StrS family aminotransferase [Cyclobacteriaceae bacterium]